MSVKRYRVSNYFGDSIVVLASDYDALVSVCREMVESLDGEFIPVVGDCHRMLHPDDVIKLNTTKAWLVYTNGERSKFRVEQSKDRIESAKAKALALLDGEKNDGVSSCQQQS